MNILLVEPEYYTQYPPLGLLKIATVHNNKNDRVFFRKGLRPAPEKPFKVYITSLFTYAWEHVHLASTYYRNLYPDAEIVLGGIYATLMPKHAKLASIDTLFEGLHPMADAAIPDYSIVPEWRTNVLFITRGCIRECAFCAVPRIEGRMRECDGNIRDKINQDFSKIILWDNNILAAPNWPNIASELSGLNMTIDFNQGLDTRLMTPEVIASLAQMRIEPIRLAYDNTVARVTVQNSILALVAAGFKRRRIIVYTLYNYTDSPEDFLQRVVDLLSWGVVSYPMRYEPLNTLIKNKYISPHWTQKQLEMVARARRVIGAGGAFPPYNALLNKFLQAQSFEEAFALRPRQSDRWNIKESTGMVEKPQEGLPKEHAAFRELFDDPMKLTIEVSCDDCGRSIKPSGLAFAFQDYSGRYVGYCCLNCHPNGMDIQKKWRSIFK